MIYGGQTENEKEYKLSGQQCFDLLTLTVSVPRRETVLPTTSEIWGKRVATMEPSCP